MATIPARPRMLPTSMRAAAPVLVFAAPLEVPEAAPPEVADGALKLVPLANIGAVPFMTFAQVALAATGQDAS